MVMSKIAQFAQFKGDIGPLTQLGRKYRVDESIYITLRSVPAILSSFVSPFLFCSLRLYGVSTISSFCCSLLIVFDHSSIVEAKFILSDGVLHFFTALHIIAFSIFWNNPTPFTCLFAGITLGLAGSCKFTALGLVAFDGIIHIFWILLYWPKFTSIVLRGFLLLAPMAITILSCWMWHFSSTPYAGHHANYIRNSDKATVIPRNKENITYWGLRCSNSPFILRLLGWVQTMNHLNMRSKIPHPFESRPEHWPLLRSRFVLFFTGQNNRKITCLGGLASHILTSVFLFISIFVPSFWTSRNVIWVLGWAVSYVPFLAVPRTMFHYHYLIPLMFATMSTASVIDALFSGNNLLVLFSIFDGFRLPFRHPFRFSQDDNIEAFSKKSNISDLQRKKLRNVIAVFVGALGVISYLYFSPWIYGTPCPTCDFTRKLTSRWDLGPPKPIYYFGKDMFSKTTKKYGKIPNV